MKPPRRLRSLPPAGRSVASERPGATCLQLFAVAAVALAATGCAGIRTISTDVSTYGQWPADRKPSTYVFERLPSQQERAAEQDGIEAAARQALASAGFTPAPAGAEPDVLVQVGVRVSRSDYVVWDDPLWWHGGFGRWPYGAWRGPAWGFPPATTSRYEREVALLIRDRREGKPLYEAHARTDGSGAGSDELNQAMFIAALKDFPATGLNPRTVTVPRQPS